MKKLLIFSYFITIGILASGQLISVMTYNIRYDNSEDKTNSWQERRELLSSQIKFHHPDIVGLQEVLYSQLSYLDSIIVDYSFVGVGKDDGQTKGEYNPIFYDANIFNVVESGTFWLSETPDTVSKGWDAELNRICTYARLHHRSQDIDFWVFNTHLDHMGEQARFMSVELITSKIDSLNKVLYLPVIVMGDFNTSFEPNSPPFILAQLSDSRQLSRQAPFGPVGTLNGFNFEQPVTQRIDYIFVSQQINVLKYGVLSDSQAGKFPSDHFPVFIEFELPGF